MLRFAIGLLVGLLVRVWALTWRVRVVGPLLPPGRARVFAFWHGKQMALLGAPRARPMAALISMSRDGQLQSGAQTILGLSSVRGSSSRGGARALRRLIRFLRRGDADVVMAVDGPRGPARRAKAGAVVAARRSGALLHPVGSWAQHALVLRSAWDEFVVPLPFSRVVVAVGEELDLGAMDANLGHLDRAIDSQSRLARGLLQPEHGRAPPAAELSS